MNDVTTTMREMSMRIPLTQNFANFIVTFIEEEQDQNSESRIHTIPIFSQSEYQEQKYAYKMRIHEFFINNNVSEKDKYSISFFYALGVDYADNPNFSKLISDRNAEAFKCYIQDIIDLIDGWTKVPGIMYWLKKRPDFIVRCFEKGITRFWQAVEVIRAAGIL